MSDNWKRNVAGCLKRLKKCERGMERTRGTCINLQWLMWNGDWGAAWEWLQKHAPKTAERYAAKMELECASP